MFTETMDNRLEMKNYWMYYIFEVLYIKEDYQ